jgi:hypothetical protein
VAILFNAGCKRYSSEAYLLVCEPPVFDPVDIPNEIKHCILENNRIMRANARWRHDKKNRARFLWKRTTGRREVAAAKGSSRTFATLTGSISAAVGQVDVMRSWRWEMNDAEAICHGQEGIPAEG